MVDRADLADPADLLPRRVHNVRDRNGKPLYPFLDPGASSFWRWVGIMIAVFIVVGFAVWAAGVLRLEQSAFIRPATLGRAQGHSGICTRLPVSERPCR